ncbi:MAG: hypothetical protein EON96_08610 [Caulobacteraceae bacterium]|nr:MAG: hypothetical protein EON96_08610 [Caulobacteraceae bacterium]
MAWVVFCRGPGIPSAYLVDLDGPQLRLEPEQALRFETFGAAEDAGRTLMALDRQRLAEFWPVERYGD